MNADHEPYTAQLLAAYEAEIAGAAYFSALATRYPAHAAFLARCTALEEATAARLWPLIEKYRLAPQDRSRLAGRGERDAEQEPMREWQQWLSWSQDSYRKYVDQYRALEAIGPPDDQAVLAALSAHELQLIGWLRAQQAAWPAEPASPDPTVARNAPIR